MTTTTYLGLTLPTVLDPIGSPAWATSLNDNFNFIDIHDHTTNKGCKVPVAGLNLNADLDLSNLYRLKKAYSVGVTNQGSAVTADTNSVQSVSGNLVWINAGGTAVQITSGAGINLSSLGTIGGDYGGADPASVFYTNATKTFSFTQDSGITAHIACGDLYIYESVASGKYIHLKPKAGLSANIDLQLPSALPAGNALVTMTSAGIIEASSIVPTNAVQSVLAASATGTLVDQDYYISPQYTLTISFPNDALAQLSVIRGVGHFYRLGTTWRMNFNIGIVKAGSPLSSTLIRISGVAFKSGTNVYQSINCCGCYSNPDIDRYGRAAAKPSTGDIILEADTTAVKYFLSGDVELNTKPSYVPAGV